MRTFYPFYQSINLFAGVAVGTRYGNTYYQFGFVEYLEIAVLREVVEFAEFHTETDIRFVVTIGFHSLRVGHTRESPEV